MTRFHPLVSLLLCSILVSDAFAQREDTPLRIFGYFQNSLQHWTAFANHPAQNSFSLQQLNLFLQKDFSRNWTAFVNFEALNNFSSSRRWGALNLEEAWVKYSANMKFNLKLGLQIPIFNNLNEIKNRTPLLPYVIRPLVYETSFGEFFPIDDFVPARAFVQAYGFLPAGETKFDYAAYLGNSPNINADPQRGQTGVDTTTTFLSGGRVGIRYRELKFGLSATYENTNNFIDLADSLGRQPAALQDLPLTRLGGDLSYNVANFSFESEFIIVDVHSGISELKLALNFYYATLGYHFTNELFGYGSYWITDVHASLLFPRREQVQDENLRVSTMGISYDLNDRIRLKGQFTRVRDYYETQFISQNSIAKSRDKFNVGALAVSVFF
ncbi:MAG: porin [bacterium]